MAAILSWQAATAQCTAGLTWKFYLVTVHSADPLIESLEELLLEVTLLLPPRIVQVVGVDDAHHMLKLVGPALAMVVPVQVFRLLQHRYICLQTVDHVPAST